MKHFLCLAALIAVALVSSFTSDASEAGGPSVLVPKPNEVVIGKGMFTLEGHDGVWLNQKDPDLVRTVSESGFRICEKRKDAGIEIRLGSDKVHGAEAYSLTINRNKVVIEAENPAGAFYAWQSLLQMLRFGNGEQLQCCTVTDSPQFGWRGMHFDVSRHFRSKEFIMKQMDAMAFFKMNKAHLHLTDAAGWRLQIDSYPRLSGLAAWRPQTRWTDWTKSQTYCEEGTAGAYGGYYTKEDIREIVEYARQRHIEVIPEIEMPGHSEEVTAVYPELSCDGRPSDLCPGNEKTFEFIEAVLTEVMEIFPSEYIHIGGDEAGKAGWKTCPLCRRRMEEEGLKDVDELQSYLIHRVEAFVNSRGRKIIGWDEILGGGLAPNATVMSWRGTEGGIQAMQEGHDVIMAPGGYCYLDHCQDAPFREPLSIGGYIPLETVYSYNPADGLPDGVDTSHLLGVQACLWAEYIPTDGHCEYMYWPRAIALAETGWTSAGLKDYNDFHSRALAANACLKEQGYNVFGLANEYGERKESLSVLEHLGVGKKVIYNIPANEKYLSSGETALTDGILGGWTYGDRKWQGFHPDFDVTVDLGQTTAIHYVGATFMQSKGAWVYMPDHVEISVSDDGLNFRSVALVPNDISPANAALQFKTFGSVCDCSARFVRLVAAPGPLKEWLFTDEIVIN